MNTRLIWMPALIFMLLTMPAASASAGTADTPVFEKTLIRLGDNELVVEVADTAAKRDTGLMFRKTLPADAGMLFVFEKEKIVSLWMKNTYIPLSVGFFDKDQVLVEVQHMEPVRSIIQINLPHYQGSQPAKYALEMNSGWFQENNIRLGSRFEILIESKSGE